MSEHCELILHQDYDWYELSVIDEVRIKPLYDQIVRNGYQFEYFVSVEFHGYRSYELVQKFIRELRRSIRKFYKDDIKMIFFIEQHQNGSYHFHAIIEDASQGRWDDPSPRMQNFLKDRTEEYIACMVGAPSGDSKVDLLKRCIRNMKFTSHGKKSVDVRPIFNLKKLLAYCTKQFEWHHPAHDIIEPASSDIDTTFYFEHKQCGTGWVKRDSDTSSGFSPTLLFA